MKLPLVLTTVGLVVIFKSHKRKENKYVTFTKIKCWASPPLRRCTVASPTPAAAAPTPAQARTVTASPGDSPAGRQAPGFRPRRPAPLSRQGTEPPGRSKRRKPRGVFWPPLRSPCFPPTLLCCFGDHGEYGTDRCQVFHAAPKLNFRYLFST